MARRQRASAGRDEPVRGEAAVAEYAEMMRGSFWARDSSLEAVPELAASSAAGEEQQAFVGMVKDTIAIHRMQEP